MDDNVHIETRVTRLEDWKQEVHDPINQLIEDQRFRVQYRQARRGVWSRYASWLGALAACTTIGITAATLGPFLLRLFGLS